ncbi:MAG: ExbD/TolR family protein [Gammaproteobacteria bacterium]|tara:strand:+ start:75 stop:476 length:402 start_codon:yes stop_codon:yes gene_type:complete
MKFAQTSNKNPTIEITPLIDIVFILVIFFVATSKITDSQFLDLDLPSTESFNIEGSSISNQIYVFNDNRVIFNNNSYTVNNDALKNALLNELIVEDTIILSIEGDVTHKITIELMDFLQKNSFTDVQIRTLAK